MDILESILEEAELDIFNNKKIEINRKETLMGKQKISVHRALAELKTYNDRISRAIHGTFVIANKKNNDKIQGKTIADYENMIKGNFASYEALTENQRRLKSAVVMSNAVTKVNIGGSEYTIAEAIERKAKLKFDEAFLQTLKQQFNAQNQIVERENAQIPTKLENYLQAVLGDKDKRSIEEIAAHTKSFEDRNKFELIDPCDIGKKIAELEESILNFKTDVDYKLSESNAITQIEVDFMD